jgi:hypothetical protein
MKRSVNTIFLKLIKSTQMKYYYARCAQAMIFGRPFVVAKALPTIHLAFQMVLTVKTTNGSLKAYRLSELNFFA